MADFIIKSAAGTGNKTLIQGQDQSDSNYAIEIGDGGALKLGTITSATFPAGMQIKQSFYGVEGAASDTGTITTSSFADTTLEISHVTAASSTDSYLEFQFYSGNFFVGSAAEATEIDVTVRTVSNSTYTAGESITNPSSGSPAYWHATGASNNHFQQNLRLFCGLVSGMGMPATKSTWSAGDTLYFRLFGKRSNGTLVFVKSGACWNLSVKEIAR